MAGTRPIPDLGSGEFPNDQIDRTPTDRYLYLGDYNSDRRRKFLAVPWTLGFEKFEGRLRHLERAKLAPLALSKNSFLGLPCDHKENWATSFDKNRKRVHLVWPAMSLPGTKTTCGKHAFKFNGNNCSVEWLLENLMTLPLHIRETIYELTTTARHSGASHLLWVNTSDKVHHPFKFGGSNSPPFPTLEKKAGMWTSRYFGNLCWIKGFAEALRKYNEMGVFGAQQVLVDFLGFVGSRTIWGLKCCNNMWERSCNTPVIEKSLTWLRRNTMFMESMQHIEIDFEPRDECGKPFTEDFVAICDYMSRHLKNISSVILWLEIEEEDFKEVLTFPLQHAWVKAFRALPITKLEVCPLIHPDNCTCHRCSEKGWRNNGGVSYRFNYFLGDCPSYSPTRSLVLEEGSEDRALIEYILTPGTKLWGYTDDMDEAVYGAFAEMFQESISTGLCARLKSRICNRRKMYKMVQKGLRRGFRFTRQQ